MEDIKVKVERVPMKDFDPCATMSPAIYSIDEDEDEYSDSSMKSSDGKDGT
jgi:hypothetical protein